MKQPYNDLSLLEFQDRFSTEKACRDHLISMRWPEGFICECGSKEHCYSPNREEFHCYRCDGVTSPTAGTLFHRSKVPLRKWFWAIFLVATSKKGVPALYLKRELKLNDRTAWSMLRKMRLSMANRNTHWKLKGSIQADEIFIGGKQTHDERRKNPNKTTFFIAVEEDKSGNPKFLAAQQIESAYDDDSVRPAIDQLIPENSILKTDGKRIYRQAAQDKNCVHEYVVAMSDPELAHAHLNWVNRVTSNLKRWLISTHHGVFPKYRKEYVAEFVYRFNRRFWPDQIFDRLLFANMIMAPSPLRGSCV